MYFQCSWYDYVSPDHGEVFSDYVDNSEQLNLFNLNPVTSVQAAKAVFTDYKAENFAVLQNIYR